MRVELLKLPYKMDALEPHISEQTIKFHYEKHHQAYVTNTNNLVKGTPLENSSLEELIFTTFNKSDSVGIFDNSAQVFNHTFYWNCMKPSGGGFPIGAIAQKIDEDFGSYDAFVEEFKTAATTQFGSGWAWLVLDDGKLKILNTSNADTPMVHGHKPLLTIDVWEHAYYLDYQNKRVEYVDNFINYLINWDFVNSQLEVK